MADEKIVTSIVANSDFSNLIADVQRVTSSLHKLQQEVAGTNRALSGQIDATNAMFKESMLKTGQFSSHFVSLTSDVEKFGKSLDGGRLKLGDYFRVYRDHVRTNGGLIRDLAKQQVQLQNAILQPLGKNAQGLMQYNVHIPRGLDLTKNKTSLLKQELQIMNKVIQDGGVQLINWGKNTQWAGRQLTVGLTLPLVAFGKAAADAFKVADQELTRLTKVYGDVAGTSAQELERVRKDVAATAKELSAAMGVNFAETISLAADIAATGKTGNELLSSLKETTRLAVLGEVDRQEAMKATLAIQTAFKQNTDELAESINFLNAVENQTSTTLNDLVTAIPKAGPVIKGLGGDIQDLALYLTAMREGGINASEGANALKSGLASLINPTKQSVGVMKSFGIDILGMVKSNAGDTTSLLLDLQSALDRLDPLSKAQAIEQLFGKFQFARISALLNNLGRQGSQTLQVLDLMKASAGELETVAGRELTAVTESAAGRYKRAVESLKADLAGVGDQFLDIATKLINVLDKIIEFGQKLPDPIKKILAFGGAFTAIIGPVIMLTGVLANFFGYIIKGLGHFKALFKGAEGFKLLTPEIMAAKAAGAQLSDEFYSDALAADTLRIAIRKLSEDLILLQKNALSAKSSASGLGQVMTTNAGTPLAVMGGPTLLRQSDPNHPLIGGLGRASAHLNPRDPNNPATIFGLTFQPEPLNRVIGKTPQILMTERLPDVEGLTSVGRRSTGVVAGEHAKYAALMAALGLQSRQEIEELKKTIRFGGRVSSEFIDTFDDILPITTDLSMNAAAQSAAIVAELKAGKISVEQAKARIMAVNAELEAMMGSAVMTYGASRGRTIDLTKTPLIDQPVVDATGKPNVRGMFRQGIFRDVMTSLGRATGTRTYGGPYSIETTIPTGYTQTPSGLFIPKRNKGGEIFLNNGDQVPGPNINADVVPAMLTPGEFVIRRDVAQQDPDGMRALNEGNAVVVPINRNTGGPIPGVQYRIIGGGIKGIAANAIATVSSLYSKNKLQRKWFWDTATGSSAAGQRSSLLLSVARGRPLVVNGKQLSAADIENLTDKQVQEIWKPYHRGHVAPHQKIVGSDDYFAPGILMPMLRGQNLAAIKSGNPKKIANAFEDQSIHPLVFLDEAAQSLGYINYGVRLEKAYNKLIAGLKKRTKTFDPKSGDSFEKFAYGILIKELRKIKNGGRSLAEDLARMGTIRGRQSNRSKTKDGEYKEGIGSLESAVILDDYFNKNFNAGGMVPGYFNGRSVAGLPKSIIDAITKKWGKVYGGNELSNQDPLHGPLQIGKFVAPRDTRMGRSGQKVFYTKPGQTSLVNAFLTGSLEDKGRYVTQQYMLGDYDVLGLPGAIEAMKAWGKKATGTFYRGINFRKFSPGPKPLPDWLMNDIKAAQASGDFSGLIGKEFIMRRSSWSSNPDIANEFGDFRVVADVKNRRVTPSSEMFPGIKFVPKADQKKSKSKKLEAARSEEESIFGGKFRIVSADKDGIRVETVAGPMGGNRRFGGPVNAGTPYVVGENGPELFVPNSSGGIIPGYKMGGSVAGGYGYARGVQKKNAGGLILRLLAAMGLATGAQTAGGKLRESGNTGAATAVETAGFMLPFMMGMPSMSGTKIPFGSRLGFSANDTLSWGQKSVFATTATGSGKAATAVGNLASSTNKFAAGFGKMLAGLTRFNVILGTVVGTIALSIKLFNDYKKTQELSAAQFGLTAEQAEKAGLKYTNFTTKLKEAVEAQKLIIAQNALAYRTRTMAGTPFNLTIEEYSKLKTEVKETMQLQIDMFDKLGSQQEVTRVAAQLKAQFIAMGMEAEDASKKIYTILQMSNKASMTIPAIASKAFAEIKTAQDAVNASLKSFNFASRFENTKDQAFALNTALSAINNSITDLYNKSEKAAVKKKQDFNETEALYNAEEQALEKISIKMSNQREIGDDLLKYLIRQDPLLINIINKNDTIVSLWQKMKIAALGYVGALETLNAKQTDRLYKITVAVSKAVEDQNRIGLLKAQYDRLNELQRQYDTLSKAAQGQSVKEQISARDAIKLIDKKIRKINEEAEARKKALREETQAEDVALRVQKQRAEYEKRLAAGDMEGAAQSQIELQRILNEQQLVIGEQQIEDSRLKAVAPLEKQKSALEKNQQDLADNAALAAENLDSVSKKLKDQQDKIDAVNSAMTTYRLQVLTNGKGQEKAAAGVIKSLKDAGVAVDEFKTTYVRGQALVIKDSAKNIVDGLLKNMESIETILAKSDIIIQADGDIIVEGKKFNTEKGTKDSPFNLGESSDLIPARAAAFGPLLNQLNGQIKALAEKIGYEKGTYFTLDEKGTRYKFKVTDDGKINFEGKAATPTKALGGEIKGFVKGTTDGPVNGPGTGTSDSILARLSNGEFVTRASSVSDIGVNNMHLVNTMGAKGLIKAAQNVLEGKSGGGYIKGYPMGGLIPYFKDGGYINPSYVADMKLPSFKTGVNYLASDTIAQLHQKEAVLPEHMNPWNPTATNPIGGNTYYVAPVINAAPGMDENAITDMAVQKVMDAFKRAESKSGTQKNMSRRYTA